MPNTNKNCDCLRSLPRTQRTELHKIIYSIIIIIIIIIIMCVQKVSARGWKAQLACRWQLAATVSSFVTRCAPSDISGVIYCPA